VTCFRFIFQEVDITQLVNFTITVVNLFFLLFVTEPHVLVISHLLPASWLRQIN